MCKAKRLAVPSRITEPAGRTPRAGTVIASVCRLLRARGPRCFPGSTTDPGGEGCRAGLPPSLRGAQRGPLTCVASSRARTSCIRKGSKPRPTVQKNRAPAAGRHPGSRGPAAMAARGHVAAESRGRGRPRRVPETSEAARRGERTGWSQRQAGLGEQGGSGQLGVTPAGFRG